MRRFLIGILLFSALAGPLSAQRFTFLSDTLETGSGLKYLIIERGQGAPVVLGKEVAFHWTGYLTDGSCFGTSKGSDPFFYEPGKGQVIKGAEEALRLMRVGDRHLLILPPELAYGARGAGEVIPPNATLIFDYTVVSVTEPKRSLRDTLMAEINRHGVEAALARYASLKVSAQDQYAFRESALNALGYALLGKGRTVEAVAILNQNAEDYPNAWNAHDSLGEALMEAGELEGALKHYERSVALNPENEQGLKNIAKLKARMALQKEERR